MDIIRETEDNSVIVSKISGKIVYQEIVSALEILGRQLKGDVLYQLIICAADTNFDEISSSTQKIAYHFQQTYKNLTNVSLALVSETDLGFGISRMIQIQSENEKININVFRTEKEARAWLNAEYCQHFQDAV